MPQRITDLNHPYDRVYRLMQILREECPWDRKQTPGSIAPCTLEEAYEVLEAIELVEEQGQWQGLKEELGDMLLHIAFYARMAEEQQQFDLGDVFDALVGKMIRRHPHVFENKDIDNAEAVVRQWDAIKAEEKPERRSLMDGIPPLPALAHARKIHQRVRSIGFDWSDNAGVIDKIREELNEFTTEVEQGSAQQRLNDEFGDVLFTLVALGDRLGLDAETCLMHTNRKFTRRVRSMEEQASCQQQSLADLSLEAQEALYQQAKAEQKEAT